MLGILSFVLCGPCTGIPALIVGLIELKNIKEKMSSEEGKAFALTGAILGGANLALAIMAILLYVVMILFFFAAGGATGFE